MGFYNVVKPCVVGKLHYATVTAQPIKVDDEVAAPLVESGSLAPYRPGVLVAPKLSLGHVDGLPNVPLSVPSAEALESAVKTFLEGDPVAESEPEKPAPRPRNPRRTKD